MSRLSTSLVKMSELSPLDKEFMWQLYNIYYAGSNQNIFNKDLDSKSHTFLLKDSGNMLRGFSTLQLYKDTYQGRKLNIIYSGDTIIEQAYWGKNEFAKEWLRFAGTIKTQETTVPLYWLLIVKGHRTYRYLSIYSREYYPRHNEKTPLQVQKLIHHLAENKFSTAYNPGTGIVKFTSPRSYLREEIASIPNKDRSRPEVQFFLQMNPGYIQGDELVCLCNLDPENLTSLALRFFMDTGAYAL